MKKYSICFFAIYCLCFVLLYLIYPEPEAGDTIIGAESESVFTEKLAEAGALVAEQTETERIERRIPEEEIPSAPVYLVCGENSEILVYYPDNNSVYKRIPIIPADLSEDDRIELSKGIRFHTLEELYHYLESITS